MPTNEQRRATAKRKLERQLERREQQAKRRRLLAIVGGIVAIAAAVALVVTFVLTDKDKNTSATASSPSSAAPAPSGATTLVRGGDGQLPAFKAPADLGANCQYPAAEPASKPVEAPKSGKVPTDPATISVSMATNQGNIGLVLNNGEATCTVNSFVSLAQKGFFNDTPCHRLTTSPSLGVLQCGDPSGSGSGGPGYTFANEYPTNQYAKDDPALQKPVLYPRGALAMANAGPDTNGSQFFLVYKDSQLPPNYTVFGTIDATGLATLDKIAAAGVAGGGQDGKPATDVLIKSVLLD
ncbi:MAG: peptidylprolyl isomerase [Mycobacterium sp.]